MANCFLNCCGPPLQFCITLSGCSAPSGMSISLTDSMGATVTPLRVSNGTGFVTNCYAVPFSGGTATFTITGPYHNPGPVPIPAITTSVYLGYPVYRLEFDVTAGYRGSCTGSCDFWSSQPLSYYTTYPYPNVPLQLRPGYAAEMWVSPRYTVTCGGYPSYDMCEVLVCPSFITSGYWRLYNVSVYDLNTPSFFNGAILYSTNFNPPPSANTLHFLGGCDVDLMIT